MAVAVLNNTLRGKYIGSKTDGKPVGRRRVFVQTETGCVLGIELDRGDNAHTVKRRLQLALNFPTEESSLTFGDLELKSDLSAVRNDSPLLLTRNFIHRSSSTPCLSPRGKDLPQRDWSDPVEIVGCSSRCSKTKQLVKDVVKAINGGVEPIPIHSGLGGAYYFRNNNFENIAIVKPTDEEPFAPNNPKGFVGKALGQPGLKRSVRVGETGLREVAAYLLDHGHFAKVPPTILVKITHPIFRVNEVNNCSSKCQVVKRRAVSKIASFQQFIRHDFDASDHGTSSFPVAAVHRIGILDARIFNTDRHGGNLLVRKVNDGAGEFGCQMELIPIDHGLCLPESLEDPYFEWMHWPQASIPFSEDEHEYIANLDPVKDSEMLRRELPMIRDASLRVLVLCTIFLKKAAEQGLCLAEIGEMMSREFKGVEEEPSELEVICMEARRLIGEREAISFAVDSREEKEIQFDVDSDEDDYLMPSHAGLKGCVGRNLLSRLDESLEEDDDEEEEAEETVTTRPIPTGHIGMPPQTISKLAMSLNGVGMPTRHQHFQFSNWKTTIKYASSKDGSSVGGGGFSRSANDQLPPSASFVKVADMCDEEWGAFLEKFQDMLPGAFEERRRGVSGQRQWQRLGTSCQF